MRLTRKRRLVTHISMTPLVDVMLILLVFFMVTSTYLDLDMMPLTSGAKPGAELSTTASTAAPSASLKKTGSLLVRLSAEGRTYVSGEAVGPAALKAIVATRIATRADTPVLILPSGAADAQALVSLMDLLERAGAKAVKVIRLEAP